MPTNQVEWLNKYHLKSAELPIKLGLLSGWDEVTRIGHFLLLHRE